MTAEELQALLAEVRKEINIAHMYMGRPMKQTLRLIEHVEALANK